MCKRQMLLSSALASTLLIGCSKKEIVAPAPIAVPIVSSCITFPSIDFAKKPATSTEDARNRFDTDETIQQIVDYMLRRNAVCG